MTKVTYPFTDYQSALNFYRYNNPARQKSVNLLELERGSNKYTTDFTTTDPQLLFAAIGVSIRATEEATEAKHFRAFLACKIGIGEERTRLHPTMVATISRVRPNAVYQWIRKAAEIFKGELIKRKLLDPHVLDVNRFNDSRKNYEAFAKAKAKEEKAQRKKEKASRKRSRRTSNRVVFRSTGRD